MIVMGLFSEKPSTPSRVFHRSSRLWRFRASRAASATPTRPSIDDDPFSYFISAAEDEPRPFLFDHLSNSSSLAPPAQEPAARFKLPTFNDSFRYLRSQLKVQRIIASVSLKVEQAFTRRRCQSPRSIDEDDEDDDLADLAVEVDQSQSQEELHLARTASTVQENTGDTAAPCLGTQLIHQPQLSARNFRSHSSRPRSWLEPPADIWTVLEEVQTSAHPNAGWPAQLPINNMPFLGRCDFG